MYTRRKILVFLLFIALIVGIVFGVHSCVKSLSESDKESDIIPTSVATEIPEPTSSPLPEVEVSLTAEGKVVDPYRIYTSDSCAHDVLSLGQQYPDVISVEHIGQSYKGKDMYIMKLGNGPTKVLLTAAIHGRENVTTNYLMRQTEEIAIAYTNSTSYEGYDVVQLLSNFTVYICPMNNPDGVDICNSYTQPDDVSNVTQWTQITWKANGRGVDLNRNFPFQWEEMKANDTENEVPSKMNFPGTSSASEPETQNLMKLVQNNDFKFCLNFHTKGKILYWRDPVNGEITGDFKLVNLLSDCLGFQVAGVTQNLKNYGGGFENWFRSATGNPGICIEMTAGNGDGDVPYNHELRGEYHDIVYDIYSGQVLDWNNSKTLIPYILENYF